MMKLLAVDDEMLVLVGLKSMLDWKSLGIEYVGTAHNGQQALEQIEQIKPEIVLIDINMPVKNGLEVAKECREKYGKLPVFIFLTSYEEFSFAQEAVSVQALDYLVKISLTPEKLEKSIRKAINEANAIKTSLMGTAHLAAGANGITGNIGANGASGAENTDGTPTQSMSAFKDRFFIRLFNNYFENAEQSAAAAEELGIKFAPGKYLVVLCKIVSRSGREMNGSQYAKLSDSTVQIAEETVNRFFPCYAVAVDVHNFALVIMKGGKDVRRTVMTDVLPKVQEVVFSYFSVDVYSAVGVPVEKPSEICNSYYSAYLASESNDEENPIVSADDKYDVPEQSSFISKKRNDFVQALENLNPERIHAIIDDFVSYYSQHIAERFGAMDCACFMLYASCTMIPDGEKKLDSLFGQDSGGIKSIYQMRTTKEILNWMNKLAAGIDETLAEKRITYKDRIIDSVKEYIRINISRRLTLNEVSDVFGFTPNYLSQMFAKSGDIGFVEYVTAQKVAAAEKLLEADANIRIYELAERLGFESAFYFSTVFKKVKGCSPSEYREKILQG